MKDINLIHLTRTAIASILNSTISTLGVIEKTTDATNILAESLKVMATDKATLIEMESTSKLKLRKLQLERKYREANAQDLRDEADSILTEEEEVLKQQAKAKAHKQAIDEKYMS